MVNEAEVAALALDLSTGILVDIRESGISVTPILDGCSVASGARWEAFGVVDVAKFTDTMLHTREKEHLNQMVQVRVQIVVGNDAPGLPVSYQPMVVCVTAVQRARTRILRAVGMLKVISRT